MAAADILNADLGTVARELRAGWDWWLDELNAMLPAGVRRALKGAPATVAAMRPDGGGHVLWRGGVTVPGGGGRAAVALAGGRVLERELTLPLLSRRDTRTLVALDLDRLTPLRPEEVVFDLATVARDPAAGRQVVMLGVVPRAAALETLAQARAQGVEPAGLGLATGAGGVRYDFLPRLVPPGPRWADRRVWWAVAGALVFLNLALVVQRDIAATRVLTEAVATQGDGVALARRLSARVAAEEARRRALVARRAAREPMGVIAAATIAVPPPAWARRLSWDGAVLRLTGQGFGVDVGGALRRAPGLADVRASSADVTPENAAAQPYDLTARVRAR